MGELEVLDWLLQQTGPSIVAILALWFQQQNHKAYVARERENADTHRADKLLIVQTIQDSTSAQVSLNSTVAQLAHVIDKFSSRQEYMKQGGD